VKNRGESFGEFRKRCIGWWKERVSVLIAEHNSSSSDNDDGEDQVVHVLVVSHGGFIRVLFQALLSDPEFRFGGDAPGDLPNTGVSIVEALGVYDGRVLVYADHSHLKADDQEEEEEEEEEEGVKTENGGM
jgi:probable phosphoglycerate mutase